METITIEEFRKIRTAPDVSRFGHSGGRFALVKNTQRKQYENLTVGDIVFFLNPVYEGLGVDGKPQLRMSVKQVRLV